MINWDMVPHSKATNSWDLLEDVKKDILEEPRRVYMGAFNIADDTDGEVIPSGFNPLRYSPMAERLPSCGMMGCISGWMNVEVARSLDDVKAGDAGEKYSLCVLLPAAVERDAKDLFWGYDRYTWPEKMTPPRKQGTLAYAEAVVNHINIFMHRWERELKNHQLPVRVSNE